MEALGEEPLKDASNATNSEVSSSSSDVSSLSNDSSNANDNNSGSTGKSRGKASDPLYKIDIPWDKDMSKVDYNAIFFDHFFPSLEGKAAVLDEYLSSPKCRYHATVAKDNIKFNRPDDEDPDKLVSAVLYEL